MRRAAPFLLCSLLALAPASSAFADPPTRSQVEELLSGIEQGPPPELLRSWGAPGVQLLMEVGNDTTRPLHVRIRAVLSLRTAGQSQTLVGPTQAYLRALAAVSAQPLMLRRAAFDALAQGFSDVAALAPFLHAPEVEVRDGAAWALRSINRADARAAMTEALRTETDATVRGTLTAGLQQAR